MRLGIAVIAIAVAVAASLVAFASVSAHGQATVAITASADEQAVDWDIDVVGGTSSSQHLTLAPTAVGLEGDFTVSISGSKATVTSTTVLPAERKLASVGCLDDLTPPTEINPIIEGSTFTLDVVPGGRFECFVSSLPAGIANPGAAAAPAAQLPTHKTLPRSDTAAIVPSIRAPGWLTVLSAVVVLSCVVQLLRPARPGLRG